jgi:TPR repeat protein
MSTSYVFLALLTFTLLTVTPSAARADAYDSGMDAYQAGDYAQALRRWQTLAKQGHAQALYNLGFIYEFGYGVTASDTQAFSHYLRAAQQGHTQAQQTVAWMYARGKGTESDSAQAARWNDIAAHANQPAITPRHQAVEPGILLEKLLTELQRAAARYDVQKLQKKKLPVAIEASNETS